MQLASLSNHDDDEGNDPNKTRQKFNEENKNFERTNVLNIIINWFLTDLCFIKSDRCDFDFAGNTQKEAVNLNFSFSKHFGLCEHALERWSNLNEYFQW